jgi:hypothetical protein
MYPLTTLTFGLCGSSFLMKMLLAHATSRSVDATARKVDFFIGIPPLFWDPADRIGACREQVKRQIDPPESYCLRFL